MGTNILIVDDEPDILKTLALRLRQEGYNIICASNGQESLEFARKKKPGIILLDIIMPGMNGLEVKARLNEDQFTASIPVIFLSVDISVESKLSGFSIGANDYITKPFNSEELLARINSVLNKKQYYEKMTMTDLLTGLYNRDYFKQQLSHIFNMAKRYSTTFSLAIIEINGFKQIDNIYGHAVADIVLQEFSITASRCIRLSDILARYDASVFVILLPETGLLNANILIKRLFARISDIIIFIPGTDNKFTFSISAGVSEFDATYRNETEFFNCTDKKLVENKP